MFTQVSRCYWCDRRKELQFDKPPDKWVLAPDWYEITGPETHGEFCSSACFAAHVIGRMI